MTRLRWTVSMFVTLFVLTGCSTYAASRYAVNAETVSALRTYRGQTVAVGPFAAAKPGESEITCRGVGPIKTPDGEPFEEFIRKALIAELTIAEVYAVISPVTLTGYVDEIDFSSGWTDAAWTIRLAVSSSNGKKLTVAENYQFKSSFVGEVACNQTAHSLMPAVQNLVGKVVRDPTFPELLR